MTGWSLLNACFSVGHNNLTLRTINDKETSKFLLDKNLFFILLEKEFLY